jgi:hypothetical protein
LLTDSRPQRPARVPTSAVPCDNRLGFPPPMVHDRQIGEDRYHGGRHEAAEYPADSRFLYGASSSSTRTEADQASGSASGSTRSREGRCAASIRQPGLHPHCDRHPCCCGWGRRSASRLTSSTRRPAPGRQVERARSLNGSTRNSTGAYRADGGRDRSATPAGGGAFDPRVW